MGRVLSRDLFHAKLCKLDWNKFDHSIEHVARLVKQYPNPPVPIQKSANLHENALCRITAEEAVFDSVGIVKSIAWRTSISESAALQYAGVSAETMLRLGGPALHLSISCLHLAIVDLLSIILDRCDLGIPKIQSFAGLEYIYACAAQS